jgi:hypothetical protein
MTKKMLWRGAAVARKVLENKRKTPKDPGFAPQSPFNNCCLVQRDAGHPG